MDTIWQSGIALDHVTQEHFEVNSIQELQGTLPQTTRLDPLSMAAVKIKIPCDDDTEYPVSSTVEKILPTSTTILELETVSGNACVIEQKQWDNVITNKDKPLSPLLPAK